MRCTLQQPIHFSALCTGRCRGRSTANIDSVVFLDVAMRVDPEEPRPDNEKHSKSTLSNISKAKARDAALLMRQHTVDVANLRPVFGIPKG